MTTLTIAAPAYTEQDHATWAALYAAQMPHAERHACRRFHIGMQQLQLNPTRLPDPQSVSTQLQRLSGWTLGNAQNDYLGATDWFEHISARRFPVTNYIRQPDELAFTPMPDLFHEYFGHLAFFTDQRFGDIAQLFGPLYLAANPHQQLEISRLWWFSLEFGLLREDGELRVLGAGLLSSPAEMAHALAPNTPREPFTIQRVAATPAAVYHMHPIYFVLECVEQIADVLQEYAHIEALKH
jgi:phenylalanine-4-hydroxylase